MHRLLVLVFAVFLPCTTAILNTGAAANYRPAVPTAVSICDSKLCTCKSNRIVCNCGSTTDGEELSFEGSYRLHDAEEVRVENCRQVRVSAATFRHLDVLRRVHLLNVGRVVLESGGFSWKLNESAVLEANPSYLDNVGSIVVSIENSTVPFVPSFTFQGRLEAVFFHRVQVGTVSPFAFSNLFRTEKIQFTDTNFTNLETQAFKKFSVQSAKFSGGHYGSLPSRTMVDLEVTDSFVVENVEFKQVFSSALTVKRPNTFRISGCRFGRVEGDAFRVVTDGPVYIEKNMFESLGAGAFAGITVSREVFAPSGPQKLVFEGNNVTRFENGSLVFNTSRIAPHVGRLVIEQPCECASVTLWADQLIIYPPSSPARHRLYRDGSHRDSTLLFCRHDEKAVSPPRYLNFRDYNRVHCGAVGSGLHVLIVVATVLGAAVVAGVVVVVVVVLCRRRRRARWINVPAGDKYEESSPNKSSCPPDGRITMVVPDGRVYRETEFHVIVEQANPITTTREEHIYQNLKPVPLPRTLKQQQPVPSLRTDL